MGGGNQQREYNRTMTRNAELDRQQRREEFDYLRAGNPEQQRFRQNSDRWGQFIAGKNYGAPPEGEFVGFDLYTPAQIARQQERMGDLTGIGAAAMGGTGDQSVALQLARERNANQAGENAGRAYEGAIKERNAYYEGNALPYAGLDINTHLAMMNNATQNMQFSYDQQRQTLPPSFWQIFAPMMGGALSAGGSLLGNPALFS